MIVITTSLRCALSHCFFFHTPLLCRLESSTFLHLWFPFLFLPLIAVATLTLGPMLFSHLFNSSALSSCHNRVYQSLANLIRWADQVMLDGIDLEDKENVASVTSVIKAVLDGVKVCPFAQRGN